mmetsp:Transcript_27869/g.73708  ORF Transcript_27869/g.73708 Transcript_27869/m.73708 type:complete len:192 (+) Transcript_27869:83-658(+)
MSSAEHDYQALYPPWTELIDSALSLGTATASLPLVSMLAFGYSIMQLLLLPPEVLEAPSLAQAAMVVALASSVAISAFTLAFALLEVYYINMISAASKRFGNGQRQQDLLEELDRVLSDFSGMRAYARNGTWASMLTMMLAVVGKLGQSGVSMASLLAMLLLFAGVVGVLSTVMSFRRAYRPMLTKAAFAR